MALAGLEYTTIREISGPLLFVESVRGVGYGELARIRTPSGEERRGQVLEIGGGIAVVQVFEGTTGLDVAKTGYASPARPSNSRSRQTCLEESSTAAAAR